MLDVVGALFLGAILILLVLGFIDWDLRRIDRKAAQGAVREDEAERVNQLRQVDPSIPASGPNVRAHEACRCGHIRSVHFGVQMERGCSNDECDCDKFVPMERVP